MDVEVKQTGLFMPWREEWELGIEEIDQQHKKIVEYVNQFGLCMYNHKEMVNTLTNLLACTREHFRFEEQLQTLVGFDHADTHQATHGIFEQQIKLYCRRANNGENICKPLAKLLSSWLISHIGCEDRQYVEHVFRWAQKNHTQAA